MAVVIRYRDSTFIAAIIIRNSDAVLFLGEVAANPYG